MFAQTERDRQHRYITNEFMPKTFVDMVNGELIKHNTADTSFAFELAPIDWEVRGEIVTVYNAGGGYQDEQTERVTRIKARGRLIINGQAKGPVQLVKCYIANHQTGTVEFHGIELMIRNAIQAPDDFEGYEKSNPFCLGKMMEQIQEDEREENLDYRAKELIPMLTDMGVSGKKATQVAAKITEEHDTVHSLDVLLDLAMEAVDAM